MRLRVAQLAQRLLVRVGSVGPLLQRAPNVIMTFFLERFVFRKERTAEPFQCLVVVAQFVGRRARIEFDPVRRVRVRILLQGFLELLIGFRVIVVSVRIQAGCGAQRIAGKEQDHGCRRKCSPWRDRRHRPGPLAFSFAKKKRRRENHQGRAQRPLITLDWPSRHPVIDFARLHFRQPFVEKLFHRSRSIFQVNIKAARLFRDFLQALFVQLRFHHLPVAVLDKSRPAPVTAERNERAFGGADPHGKNSHARIGRALRGGERIAAQLLAVGKDNQRAVADGALSVGLHRQVDRG